MSSFSMMKGKLRALMNHDRRLLELTGYLGQASISRNSGDEGRTTSCPVDGRTPQSEARAGPGKWIPKGTKEGEGDTYNVPYPTFIHKRIRWERVRNV